MIVFLALQNPVFFIYIKKGHLCLCTLNSTSTDWAVTKSLFLLLISISETLAGHIAENLLKAKEIALNDSGVPEQLTNYLQKALDVALGLDPYLDAMAPSKRYRFSFVTLCFCLWLDEHVVGFSV